MDDDDLGYTLDFESILRLRRTCESVESVPVNRVRSLVRPSAGYQQSPGLQFKNNSGETAPAGACMRVTGFTDDAEATGGGALGKGQPIIKIGKPDATFGIYVINDMAAIDDGAFGTCYDVGDVPFLYDSGTPARGEGYGPKPSQWSLSKGFPCLVRVYGLHSTSRTIAYGNLAPITTLLGKSTGAITANSSTSSWQIWTGTTGSEANSTFTAPSAYSRVAIDSGLFVRASWWNNGWNLEQLQCNV